MKRIDHNGGVGQAMRKRHKACSRPAGRLPAHRFHG